MSLRREARRRAVHHRYIWHITLINEIRNMRTMFNIYALFRMYNKVAGMSEAHVFRIT